MTERENTIGDALREARLTKGLTQAALGEKMGYSAMAISHFENGTRPVRLAELRRASEILDCNLMELTPRTTGAVLFRASSVRGGAGATMRSIQAFDKFIDKKYGNNESPKNSD